MTKARTAILVLALGVSASAKAELQFRELSGPDTLPLTTERAWKVDGRAVNPHRRTWLLDRQTSLQGLETVETKVKERDGEVSVFRVRASGVTSTVSLQLRTPGARYGELKDFPCSAHPDAFFATPDGARVAATRAVELWSARLRGRLPSLETALNQVSAHDKARAERMGQRIFRGWLLRQESEWRGAADREGRAQEWEFYRREASAKGFCRSARPAGPAKRWEPLMEPPYERDVRKGPGTLLARAPAKLWDGIFTVRATVQVGGLRLVGRFMLDAATPLSLLSPTFLKEQGAGDAHLVGLTGDAEVVHWRGERRVVKRLYADTLEVAGYPFSNDEFGVTETRVFLPPNYKESCCDGVLGLDFLQNHVVEIHPDALGPNVKIWDRERFALPATVSWAEASVGVEAGLVAARSECAPVSAGRAAQKTQTMIWGTAESVGLRLPSGAEGKMGARCGDLELSGTVPAADGGPALIGMGLLGQAPFTLDLPHGRVWFEAPGTKVSGN